MVWIGAHKFDGIGGTFGAFSMAYTKAYMHCLRDTFKNPTSLPFAAADALKGIGSFALNHTPDIGISVTIVNHLISFSVNWAKEVADLDPNAKSTLLNICKVFPIDEITETLATPRGSYTSVPFYEHHKCKPVSQTNIPALARAIKEKK